MSRRETDRARPTVSKEHLLEIDRLIAVHVQGINPALVNDSIPQSYSRDEGRALRLLTEQTAGQSISIFSDKEHFWTVLINGTQYLGFADGTSALPLAICRALLNRAGVMPEPLEIPELEDEEDPT